MRGVAVVVVVGAWVFASAGLIADCESKPWARTSSADCCVAVDLVRTTTAALSVLRPLH